MAIADDLACIARQESGLEFQHFNEDTAWALGSTLHQWGIEGKYPIVIDVRRFDRQLFFAALKGSVPDNTDWVRRKSNLVLRFHRSSYAVGLELALKEATLESRYGLSMADYAAHGGSFPIRVQGAGVIGSVTVSGLKQRDDHDMVVRGIAAVLGNNDASLVLPPVE